jgi:hypothetical protein
MRLLGLAPVVAAAALVLAALLSSTPEVSAARVVPAPLADQQPRKPAGDNAASSARLDASSWKAAASLGGSTSSPPSTVFDPDRMSKRRVRRGSDPIHNKC